MNLQNEPAQSGNLSEWICACHGNGDSGAIVDLLRAGANPNGYDRYGMTALARCIQFKRLDLVETLLAFGADPNQPNLVRDSVAASGHTPLTYAAMCGSVEIVQTLLDHAANIEQRDAIGSNAVIHAALNGNYAVVSILRKRGATICMAEAAVTGDVESLETLLRDTPVPDEAAADDAFILAARSGQAASLELMLEYGQRLETKDKQGMSVIMHACAGQHLEMVTMLLERGADPNSVDNSGMTPLSWPLARLVRDTSTTEEIVGKLLGAGAGVNLADNSGWTPLMLASLFGYAAVVVQLLEAGAYPDALPDANSGMEFDTKYVANALTLALGNDHKDVIRVLLEFGANPLAINGAGLSAIDYARKRMDKRATTEKSREIMRMLYRAAKQDNLSWSPP